MPVADSVQNHRAFMPVRDRHSERVLAATRWINEAKVVDANHRSTLAYPRRNTRLNRLTRYEALEVIAPFSEVFRPRRKSGSWCGSAIPSTALRQCHCRGIPTSRHKARHA